jgi:folate-binding protein YgfZ
MSEPQTAVPDAADYGDALAEYRAVRSGAGMRQVASRGRLRLTGRDRVAWLHAICTQDLKRLRPGQGAYATCINDVGRLMFDFQVWVTDDALLLDVEGAVRTKAAEWLDRFLITEDVVIEDVSDTVSAIEIVGPRAADVVADLGAVGQAPFDCFTAAETWVLSSHGTGLPTFQVWGAPSRIASLLSELQGKVVPFGTHAWEVLRIEAGHAVYGVDMDEDNNPLEAGLNRAVSLDKGCYTGQEVMARLTFRQGPVRHFVGFQADALWPAATPLFVNDKEMGRITSSTVSPALGVPIAIGFVRREHKEPGSTLMTADARPVQVVELPWVKAGSA